MHLHLGKRLAPPRFVLFTVLLLGGLGAGIPMLGLGRGTMAGFDIAAFVFLVAVAPLFRHGSVGEMRAASERNDANRTGLLLLTGAVMIVVLVAVAAELSGKNDPLAIALVLATLVLAWLFSNTVYALHYAHLYYRQDDGEDTGGIDIPKCDEPDYWDFVYFSFCLGMTFQTSDVDITSRQMRRIVTGHCLAAFVFNLGVLAFTINVIGG